MGAISGGGLSLGTLSIAIEAAVDQALKDIQNFGTEVGKVIDEQQTKWQGLANVGDGLVKVGAALTAGVTLPLLGVGTAAVTVSEQLNQARVGFTTMLGSGEAASAMLAKLQQFAATTPFEFPDLVKSAQRMMALGFSAEQVIPTLRTIGDTAAGMGSGKETIDGITLALGQMQSKGKVSAQEMNQLAERGVPAWQILADAIGVSIPEAMKLAEKGAISASEAVPALLGGMNEKFAGNMDQMSKTLTGQWSNFKDTIGQALIPIGEALTPALTGIVKALTPLIEGLKSMAEWFNTLPDPVKNAALAFVAVAAAAGPIILGIGGIITAVTTLGPAIAGIAGALGLASSAALIPFAAAVAGVVAALVLIGTWVHQNWDGIVAALSTVWGGIQTAWEGFSGWVAGWWNAIWGGIVTIWHSVMDPLFSVLAAIWDGYTSLWGAAWDGIVSLLQGLWGGIVTAWHAVIDPFLSILATGWDFLAGVFTAAWGAITAALQAAWGLVVGGWNTVMGPFIGTLSTIWDGAKAAAEAAWGAISSAIGKVLDLAGKIPGVSGIINGFKTAIDGGTQANKDLEKALDKSVTQVGNAGAAFTAANQKAKDLKEQTDKTAAATKAHSTAAANSVKVHGKLAPALDKTTAAAKDAEDKFKPLITRNEDLYAIANNVTQTQKKLAENTVKATQAMTELGGKLETGLGPAIASLNLGSTQWLDKFSELGKTHIPKVIEQAGLVKPVIDPMVGSIASMNQGLSTLGITSSATFTQLAKDAQAAYEKVIAAPDATQWEKDSAFLKLLEAQKKAVLAAGQDFPAATEQMMANIKTKVEGKAPDINGAFTGMTKGISTVITNFAQDISKSLWEGDDSWGEKGKKLLTSLGEAVTSSLLEPAANAIGKLISGALTDLLGGNGLGGVLDSIKNIGKGLSDVFSSGGGAASAAGGGGGGAGSAAGGIAGVAGGAALGWANLGVSIVSGVVSFFQNSEQNKTLDKVVLHTLQTANDLANLRVDDWDRFGQYATWKDDILNALGRIQGDTGITRISMQETEHHCWQASATLGDMLSDMRGGAPAAATFMEDVVNLLTTMVGKLDGIAGGSMTMNLNGTDPTTVGGIIAGRLRRQGAFG